MNIKEVKKKIGERNLSSFLEFMEGQTVGINKDGTIDYYETDVLNFINKMKGGRMFWD